MVIYGSKELTQGTWGKRIKEHQVNQTIADTHIQFQNKAENLIREINKNGNGSCSGVEHLRSYGIYVQRN